MYLFPVLILHVLVLGIGLSIDGIGMSPLVSFLFPVVINQILTLSSVTPLICNPELQSGPSALPNGLLVVTRPFLLSEVEPDVEICENYLKY